MAKKGLTAPGQVRSNLDALKALAGCLGVTMNEQWKDQLYSTQAVSAA
jgi:hypothetical protein